MDILTLALAKKYADRTIKETLDSVELGVYKYKGSVNDYSDLPSGADVGDVYNVISQGGLNYAWNGTEWDSLGSTTNLELKVDNLSISAAGNILALAGFDTAPVFSYPIKSAAGTITWVEDMSEDILRSIGELPEGITSLVDYIAQLDAQNVKGIKINGEIINPTTGVIELPLATQNTYGLVKSSQNENSINVLENGSMEVNSLNVNKLSQTEGEDLILACGDAN